MNQIFGTYKTANYTVENARRVNMHNKLMKEKIGAVITTDYHIRTKDFDDDNIIFFAPKSDYLQRTLYIIVPKNVKLPPVVKKFLDIAKSVSNIEQRFL